MRVGLSIISDKGWLGLYTNTKSNSSVTGFAVYSNNTANETVAANWNGLSLSKTLSKGEFTLGLQKSGNIVNFFVDGELLYTNRFSNTSFPNSNNVSAIAAGTIAYPSLSVFQGSAKYTDVAVKTGVEANNMMSIFACEAKGYSSYLSTWSGSDGYGTTISTVDASKGTAKESGQTADYNHWTAFGAASGGVTEKTYVETHVESMEPLAGYDNRVGFFLWDKTTNKRAYVFWIQVNNADVSTKKVGSYYAIPVNQSTNGYDYGSAFSGKINATFPTGGITLGVYRDGTALRIYVNGSQVGAKNDTEHLDASHKYVFGVTSWRFASVSLINCRYYSGTAASNKAGL